MGPEPLFGSAGSGGCTKSRLRRHTHKGFTQLRAAQMRKTLLLLVWIDSSSCSGMQEATVSLELDVGGCLLAVLPFLRRMGLLLYAQGVTHRQRRRRGQKWQLTVRTVLHSAIIPTSDGRGQGH